MTAVLRSIGALSLFVLPGAWLAFGLTIQRSTFRGRLALSVVLGPIVMVPQFYLLRWAGLSFEHTAYVISLVNLPALWLVLRHLRGVRHPSISAVLVWSLSLLLPGIY